jgi:hypothetical protein
MKILGAFGAGFGLVGFAAWLTHVIVCIKASSWVFLLAGAIFAPIGVVHGVGVWFGAW